MKITIEVVSVIKQDQPEHSYQLETQKIINISTDVDVFQTLGLLNAAIDKILNQINGTYI